MKQVSKEEFYAFVGPLDLVLDVHSSWPTTLYKTRQGGSVMGKVVESSDYAEAAIGEGNMYFLKG